MFSPATAADTFAPPMAFAEKLNCLSKVLSNKVLNDCCSQNSGEID